MEDRILNIIKKAGYSFSQDPYVINFDVNNVPDNELISKIKLAFRFLSRNMNIAEEVITTSDFENALKFKQHLKTEYSKFKTLVKQLEKSDIKPSNELAGNIRYMTKAIEEVLK